MMEHLPAMTYGLTAETQALKDALDAEANRHNDACESVAAEESRLRATPADEWSAAHGKAATKIRDRKTELLANEIALRNRRQAYFRRLESVDHPAAVDAAIAEEEESRRDVLARLASIGYPPDNIAPGFVFCHPIVRAATEARETRHGAQPWHENEVQNIAANDRAMERMAAIKQSAVAV